ncbi:MAG: hypothetical protein PWQ96_2418 [Clostridia bacterium]|nr:hypothetical protein [Clostridia bacterium]
MAIGRALQKPVIARTTLSDRELDVAMLARINIGRNAISGILGISVNSVKTLLKRIENKLGPNWRHNSHIVWPAPENKYLKSSNVQEENDPDDFENGYYHRLERELKRQRKARQTSFLLLLNQSHPGKDILHVSSAQRFWLRPALKELENRKHIKLLAVDWNETFSPPWLPLVNRGRKEIRAADYVTFSEKYVTGYIRNYLEHKLKDYILEVNGKLEEVRQAVRKENDAIPGLQELISMAAGIF